MRRYGILLPLLLSAATAQAEVPQSLAVQGALRSVGGQAVEGTLDDGTGEFGMHSSSCPSTPALTYIAIDLGTPKRVQKLRVVLHTNPPKGCTFEGSTTSTDGLNGSWITLLTTFDFPSGQEQQWWEKSFSNSKAYRMYRLYCPGSPSNALYEWEMYCTP